MSSSLPRTGFPRPRRRLVYGLGAAVAALLLASSAWAAIDAESQYVLNSFSFLAWGALVMWMCAGFTMLESGTVRTKNASVICLKNIGLYAIACLTFYFVGYNLMYTDVSGWIGTLEFLYETTPQEQAVSSGNAAAETVLGNKHAKMSDWFFQMVFVATTASIVSGALAERIKMWPFFLFTGILTTVIYPIVGSWIWGGGWLSEMGFQDFAGSTVVHSTGGWAALAGIIILGARTGKFRVDGSVKPTPPSNVPAVTLGVFILWFGWFGFNGGSQLALSGAADAIALSNIFANTNLAAAAGVMAAITISRPVMGKVDLLAALNGAIGGLVAITAGPGIAEHDWAVIIGAVGGAAVVCGMKLLEILRLDDVVGAVPAHLFAGVWGTLATSIAAGADLTVQIFGIVSVGIFVFVLSLLIWWIIDLTLGTRVTLRAEELGQDIEELGIEAYPEFVLMPDEDITADFRPNSPS